MARRPKSSVAEDLTVLVAKLPWWLGIALAVAFYVLLHRIATPPAAPTQPPTLASQRARPDVLQMVGQGLATAGQYALPLICLAGAGLSAWKRTQRRALAKNVTQSTAADVLDGVSWQQFEQLVAEVFSQRGYTVTETGGGGADGGVDLVLRKGGEKFLVQCKQWRAFKVGVEVVRELYGVMAARGSSGGFVVTSGRFTEEAKAFARGRNIELMDGTQLKSLLRRPAQVPQQQTQAPARQNPKATPAANTPRQAQVDVNGMPLGQPVCPACAKPMVRRVAQRGKSAGDTFWGCTGYPACKGTRTFMH